jgi:hypothetical protein
MVTCEPSGFVLERYTLRSKIVSKPGRIEMIRASDACRYTQSSPDRVISNYVAKSLDSVIRAGEQISSQKDLFFLELGSWTWNAINVCIFIKDT